MKEYKSGALCIVHGEGSLYMEFEAREFIGKECIIIKMTKAGLIQVCLVEDEKKIKSFAQRNIDFI